MTSEYIAELRQVLCWHTYNFKSLKKEKAMVERWLKKRRKKKLLLKSIIIIRITCTLYSPLTPHESLDVIEAWYRWGGEMIRLRHNRFTIEKIFTDGLTRSRRCFYIRWLNTFHSEVHHVVEVAPSSDHFQILKFMRSRWKII